MTNETTETAAVKPTNFEELKETATERKEALEDVTERYNDKYIILNERLRNIELQWQADHSGLIKEYAEAGLAFTEIDKALRDAAIAEYQRTNEKQMGFGISVRVGTVYKYDNEKAVNYAIEHNMPTLLKIDKVKFENIAAVMPIDFVQKFDNVTSVVSYKDEK